MFEYFSELKLTFLALIGVGISWTNINNGLQAAVLLVSLITALIALYKTLKHIRK